MFGLFYNGSFKDFWQNKPGDNFLELTCLALELDINKVELVYYPDLKAPPTKYEVSTSDKGIVPITEVKTKRMVKNEDGTDSEEVERDNEGLPLYDVKVTKHTKIKPKEVYFSKGVKNKDC